MAKYLLGHARVVNDGNDAHRALTDGAAQRVNMPDAQDQVREVMRFRWLRVDPPSLKLRRTGG